MPTRDSITGHAATTLKSGDRCANEFGPPTGENEEFEPWSADDEKEAMEFTATAKVAAEMRH